MSPTSTLRGACTRAGRCLLLLAVAGSLMVACSQAPAAAPGGAAPATQPAAQPAATAPTPTSAPVQAAAPTKPAQNTSPAAAPTKPASTQPPAATPTAGSAPAASPKVTFAGSPRWRDGLDGTAESGAPGFSGPRTQGSVVPSQGIEWVAGAEGQGVRLAGMDAYVGYQGSRLSATEGAVVFRFKPPADVAATYAQRHPEWRDYGSHKPPHYGYLLDTIGWNAAPKGSWSVMLDPAAEGNLSYGVWDGRKWYYVHWRTPADWRWDSNRWYEIGVTWGPKGLGILVDGELKASAPDVVSVSTELPWFLGQGPWYWPYGPHTMMGTYDDLRVYAKQPDW